MPLFTRLGCTLAATVALGLVAPHAVAQTADDATRSAARSLGYEGISDFQDGKFAAAADKLDRAFRALRVPSLGLWSARALEKTGELVAAAERYLEVQRLSPGEGDLSVQQQAQQDAEREHAALVPRIPSIVIQLEGVVLEEVIVTVDGTPVPISLIGVRRPVDPGAVKVEARYAGRSVTESATLEEGESKTLTLRFGQGTTAPPAAAAPRAAPAVVPGTSAPTDVGVAPPASGAGLRTVGFVALAVGGAGVVSGAVTGALAMSQRSIDGCKDTRCPPSAQDEVDAYNQLRMISGASFIGGGVLAATGLVLVLTAPSSKARGNTELAPSVAMTPWLAPGVAGFAFEARR